MTRRLTVEWPDAKPFEHRRGEPIRFLAVSDAVDHALEHAINREALGRIDAVVGAGDLDPGYLGFLGDAFAVPVAFVRGNHDHGGQWAEERVPAPHHLESGRVVELEGLSIAPLEWPGMDRNPAIRDEWRAWLDVIRVASSLLARRLRGRRAPVLVLSHAPPRGVGDNASDPYHVGYAGYRWLLDRFRPPLWLHGHTAIASIVDWRERHGESVVANVTGAVVIELVPPK